MDNWWTTDKETQLNTDFIMLNLELETTFLNNDWLLLFYVICKVSLKCIEV